MRIHLLVNRNRSDALEAAKDAASWLQSKNVIVGADGESADLLSIDRIESEAFGACELVIAFGGDGTLIRAAYLCSSSGTPILGVYYGRFGFVTQCTASELRLCVREFMEGKSKIESRMMLHAELKRNGAGITVIHALNEVVVQRAVDSNMMTFQVHIDGHPVASYPADGVMVCSATGSTAYNLSIGGPIVDPKISAMILNAIAPHTLAARPLVLSSDSTIDLAVDSSGEAVLSVDGLVRIHVLSGDVVTVRRSSRLTRLVSVEKDDFLDKLGRRLQWSQRLSGDHP